MNRLEAWLLHSATLIVTLTGLLYVVSHYFIKPVDPFSVVGTPWEPAVLKIHIVVAPVLIFAIGIIVHSHILFKLNVQTQVGRRTGIAMIPLFLIMVFSGYVLQIVTGGRKAIVIVHLASGVLWFLLYAFHQISAYAVKKATAERSAARRQAQDGSAF